MNLAYSTGRTNYSAGRGVLRNACIVVARRVDISGRSAAVETAVEQMMLDHGVLDDPTIAAIANADAEYERGEFVEWRDVRDELRRKYLGK